VSPVAGTHQVPATPPVQPRRSVFPDLQPILSLNEVSLRMTRYAFPAVIFASLFFGIGVSCAQDAEEESEYGVLVDEPGVDLTHAYCAACHSEMLVAQQGLTRAHWDELLEWMVEEQGMSEIEEPDRTIVLDYLEENYNTDRPNFPKH